jgi:hypothetical protein
MKVNTYVHGQPLGSLKRLGGLLRSIHKETRKDHTMKFHSTNYRVSKSGRNLAGDAASLRQAMLGALLCVFVTASVLASPQGRHSDVDPSHKHLASWQELYWRWAFGDISLPVDENGNAVWHNVVMIPIPATPGDGTPGHQEVRLHTGQRWVLPLFLLPGTSYSDGTPPDPFVSLSIFETMNVSLKVDGETIVEDRNVLDFFYQATLSPPIPYDATPIQAIIWFEGLGLPVQAPFHAGTHSIQLDLGNTEALPPYFGGGFAEFHNTWNITVVPCSN